MRHHHWSGTTLVPVCVFGLIVVSVLLSLIASHPLYVGAGVVGLCRR